MAGWLKHSLGKSRLLGTAVVAMALVSACGIFSGKPVDKTADWSADKLYADAQDQMSASGWESATKDLQSLQTRFPFGRYAQQAMMEECYVEWKAQEPEQALAACNRFIKQYPNNPNIDYVYYLKGLVKFNGDLGVLGFLSKQDLTERDPKALRESFDAFKEVTERFPNSRYVPDSLARMRYLVNAMASHEAHVASYYLRRGAYVAAIDRAKVVLLDYPQAPATEEALEVMVASYDKLDMPTLRDDAKRVLQKNFPKDKIGEPKPKEKGWWQFW